MLYCVRCFIAYMWMYMRVHHMDVYACAPYVNANILLFLQLCTVWNMFPSSV